MKCGSSCFKNKNIKSYIEKHGQPDYCSYTKSNEKVVSVEEIGVFIRKCLSKKYEYLEDNVLNYDYVNKHYNVPILSLSTILKELDFVSEGIDYDAFIGDIFSNSKKGEIYFKTFDYPKNDLEIVIKDSLSEGKNTGISKNWNIFKHIVRKYNRYFDISPSYSKLTYLEVIKEYLPYLEKIIYKKERFYRARIFQQSPNENIYYDPENSIAPPSSDFASNNRMSPRGISYLYLSDNKNSTFSEIRASSGDKCILGEFETNKELKVIDFTKKTKFNTDIFSDNYKETDNWVHNFFSEFALEISKKVEKEKNSSTLDSNYEYIATQILSEYIRYLGYDGIKFYSSVSAGNSFTFFYGPESHFNNLPTIRSYKDAFEIKKISLVEIKEIIEEPLLLSKSIVEFHPEYSCEINYTKDDFIILNQYLYDVIEENLLDL